MSPRYSTEQKDMIGIYIALYLNVYASGKLLEESRALYESNPAAPEREAVKKSVDLLLQSIDMLKSTVPGSIKTRVYAGKKISDLEALAIDTLLKLEQKSQ